MHTGASHDLFGAAASGKDVTPITSTDDLNETAATASRDGRRLAYAAHAEGEPGDVYVAAATGSGADDTEPALAGDGRIAFVSDREGEFDLFVAAADGSGPAT